MCFLLQKYQPLERFVFEICSPEEQSLRYVNTPCQPSEQSCSKLRSDPGFNIFKFPVSGKFLFKEQLKNLKFHLTYVFLGGKKFCCQS